MTTKLTDEQIAEQTRIVASCKEKGVGLLTLIAIAERLLAEVRASRSSSVSKEREAGRADGLDEAASVLVDAWDDGEQGRSMGDPEDTAEVRLLRGRAAKVRALSSAPPSPDSGERVRAPSPRSEAGRTEVGGNYWPSADEVEVPCPGWPDCEYVQNPPGHKHYAPSAPVPAESATKGEEGGR